MTSGADRTILRDLAKRVAEAASLPVMAERRALWRRHNALEPGRPMILVFPEGSWRELLPDSVLECEGKRARRMEWALRMRLYTHEHLGDDTVIEKEWVVERSVRHTGWGLEPKRKPSSTRTGAWAFDPVLLEASDVGKLRMPEVVEDEEATAANLAEAEDVLGDILEVRPKGVSRLSFHLMKEYTSLRGLEQTMMDMVDAPEMLHEAMGFLEAGCRGVVRQYEERGLLSLNNDGTYHSSGGNGYTDELPAPGFDGVHVRPCDLWASAEAQEMAGVSPGMHREFVLDYEKRLLEPFGLNGYGCCEDLTRKLDDVLTIRNLRRVSISPWADVDACAERLGRACIFSWKPRPTDLVGRFDEEAIRAYLRHTVEAARGCVLEMILKDTHTCENRPERFTRWAAIAREVVEEAA